MFLEKFMDQPTASYKVYQLLSHCLWFSTASSITKTGRHDIAEILLKVALNTKKIQLFQKRDVHTKLDIYVFIINL